MHCSSFGNNSKLVSAPGLWEDQKASRLQWDPQEHQPAWYCRYSGAQKVGHQPGGLPWILPHPRTAMYILQASFFAHPARILYDFASALFHKTFQEISVTLGLAVTPSVAHVIHIKIWVWLGRKHELLPVLSCIVIGNKVCSLAPSTSPAPFISDVRPLAPTPG